LFFHNTTVTNKLVKTLSLLALIFCSLTSYGQEIAITIDDLPFVGLPKNIAKQEEEGLKVVQSINKSLDAYQITATGFVVGQRVNKKTIPALQAFIDAGNLIGNHSWSHADFNKISIVVAK